MQHRKGQCIIDQILFFTADCVGVNSRRCRKGSCRRQVGAMGGTGAGCMGYI